MYFTVIIYYIIISNICQTFNNCSMSKSSISRNTHEIHTIKQQYDFKTIELRCILQHIIPLKRIKYSPKIQKLFDCQKSTGSKAQIL